MKYIELQFEEIAPLMNKHEKTLNERSLQKEFYSEFHRLLDTKYIIRHQEFVESKGSPEYKRMSEKDQDFYTNRRKETADRCKRELDNYEKNRSLDEKLHKALDGLYNGEKLRADYACILMYNLISDWETSNSLENGKKAFNARKKYKWT